jgi:xanthine dehydrogenase accessory factor
MNKETPIFIYGGNEIASAIALKLFNSRVNVVLYVTADEAFLRHNLCFGDAIFQNQKTIENVTAVTIPEDLMASTNNNSLLEKVKDATDYIIKDRKIPVLNQISLDEALEAITPKIVVHTMPTDAPGMELESEAHVIGLYPDHSPGKDCHFAIETRLNYRLGEIYNPETRDISAIKSELHFLKDPFSLCPAPIEGVWVALKEIGEEIKYYDPLGKINDIEIRSPYDGQIWGIVHSGKYYAAKSTIAKIHTGLPSENYRYFSFRENAIAGGVLEAVLKILNY